MPVSKDVRAAVLFYWGYKCWYSGHDADQIDHIVPLGKGGTDDPGNLIATSSTCNFEKSDRWLHEEALQEALRAANEGRETVLALAELFRAGNKHAQTRLHFGSIPLRGTRSTSENCSGPKLVVATRTLEKTSKKVVRQYFPGRQSGHD